MNPEEIYSNIDFEPAETWVCIMPKCGDHIRVSRGLYYHHGIYVSRNEVVHFTGTEDDSVLDWSKAKVIQTDMDYFLKAGQAEVREYNNEEIRDLYPVAGIVQYARACLGDGSYDLVFNNCEHFANACTLGRYRSRQVENILGGNLFMGVWGAIKGFFGIGGSSSSGDRSTSNYNYEPDKVKVAQIEADLKLRMADKEMDRIELMRDARLELLKAQTMSQLAVDEARAKGLQFAAEKLAELQNRMLEISQKRIEIIEHGSLPIVKEIETFYNEIGGKIEADGEKYNTEKLPKLLALLGQYEKDSPEHKIFMEQINDDRARQNEYVTQQLGRIQERQNAVLQSFLDTKKQIIDQTGKLTQLAAERYLALPDQAGDLPAAAQLSAKEANLLTAAAVKS